MFLNQINAPVVGEDLKRWAEIRFQAQYSIAMMAAAIADSKYYTNAATQNTLLYKAFDESKPGKLWQKIKELFK